jgi:O-antigen ligase/tetratricopeptide (TPR) repeat protein
MVAVATGSSSALVIRDDLPSRARVTMPAEAEPLTKFDLLIEWLLYGLLIFSPLAMGVVHSWSELVFVGLCAAIAICLSLKMLARRDSKIVWSWSYLPVVLFVVLTILQLAPLPNALVAAIAPKGLALRTRLLSDLPQSGASLQNVTLSFYPLATRHDLWLVLSYATIFFAVVNVFRRRQQIRRLLFAITLIAAAVVLLALLQDVTRANAIYFKWLSPSGVANSGPFANHSHFGQFMNLSIGAAIALMLIRLREMTSLARFLPSSLSERIHLPEFRVVWLCAFVIVAGALAIFLSMSRGGITSSLLASIFIAVMMARYRKLRPQGWIMLLLALFLAAGFSYGLFSVTYDRWINSHHIASARDRWQMIRDAFSAWRTSPIVGTGLGTNAVVLPMFDSSESSAVAVYADNDYAQAAIEMGVIGLTLVIAFVTLTWINFARSIRRGGSRTCVAAFGLGFGLFAGMIHSWSDYGQHIPAIGALTAISCGLLVTLSRLQPGTESTLEFLDPVTRSSRFTRTLRLAANIVVVCVTLYALSELNASRRADAFADHASVIAADLEQKDWQDSNEAFAALITAAESAANAQPQDMTHRYWLNVYRWRSISRVTDEETGSLLMSPESTEFARQILSDLHAQRRVCPTLPEPYGLAGQIEAFILEDRSAGFRHIRTALELQPNDHLACFNVGLIDALEGRFDDSIRHMQKANRLDHSTLKQAVYVYLDRVDRPDLAVAVAHGDAQWLIQVAQLLDDSHVDLRKAALLEAMTILKERCLQPGATSDTFATAATLCWDHEDYVEAAEHYRRALESDYGQVQWRVAFARSLAKSGQPERAVQEARICLRLDPQTVGAQQLIRELSVQSHPSPSPAGPTSAPNRASHE